MPQEAKFDIALKPPGLQKINSQAGVSAIDSVNGAVVALEKNGAGAELEGAIDGFEGDGERFKFLAIHAEKYQAKVCGKDEDAILFRINGNEGVWRLLSGPVLFINQPGHELIPTSIEFKGRIELIDLNAEKGKQKVQVFVTYGKGKKFPDQKLPDASVGFCQPCVTERVTALV